MGAGVQLQRGRLHRTTSPPRLLSQRDLAEEQQTIVKTRPDTAPAALHEYISAPQPPADGSLVVDRCHAVCHPLDASHLVPPSSDNTQRDLETRSATQLHWLTGAAADLGTRAPACDWLEVETHYFWLCSSTSHHLRRLPESGQQPLASVSRGALRSNPCALRPLIGSHTVPPKPHPRRLESLDSPRVGISIIDS
ncbi:hypothetical protein ST47_g5130 [Ascochyta rabiei]|uniref:Uncharacterized protein n=1 Tax=Didymella rabiei TaxID=5454 RepID=A0A163EK23_DIDRA|nr:hypothetical protein ST47_g5130 [Ascochyta rabiei]